LGMWHMIIRNCAALQSQASKLGATENHLSTGMQHTSRPPAMGRGKVDVAVFRGCRWGSALWIPLPPKWVFVDEVLIKLLLRLFERDFVVTREQRTEKLHSFILFLFKSYHAPGQKLMLFFLTVFFIQIKWNYFAGTPWSTRRIIYHRPHPARAYCPTNLHILCTFSAHFSHVWLPASPFVTPFPINSHLHL
jgi:hypothetical protein